MMRRLFPALVLTLALPTLGRAQFWDKLSNPKVTVTIQHPPELDVQVKRIAFGPARGEGADQFVDALVEHFVRQGAEVVDRTHLEALLREHDFALSGYVDRESTAELGRILGPSALIFVNVSRFTTDQKHLYQDLRDGRGYPHRKWISKTEVAFKASVQTVDLASGRIFAAKTVEATRAEQTTSMDACCAEFPSAAALTDFVLHKMTGQVGQLFFPWRETRALYFFDDKDCNLKTAFTLLKAGDLDGTLRQSEANLAACKGAAAGRPKPKVLAHALYNVGMGHFMTGNHEKALAAFTEAQQAHPMDITTEAMAECRRAQHVAEQARRQEERIAVQAAAAEHQERPVRGEPRRERRDGGAPTSVEERLKRLEELFKKGLLSREEYEAKKKEILREL